MSSSVLAGPARRGARVQRAGPGSRAGLVAVHDHMRGEISADPREIAKVARGASTRAQLPVGIAKLPRMRAQNQ